jgi:hypothetical protein
MGDVPEARAIPDSTAEEMVRTAEPTWRVREVVPADRGFCSVYRAVVTDDETSRELYVKGSPDGQAWGIPDEARIQAVGRTATRRPSP